MDHFDFKLLRSGCLNAIEDVQTQGIEYAVRHAGNIMDDGIYATSYRSTVNIISERLNRV